MRCKPGQLAANLEGKGKNKGLASIYLLHGEEPLQLIEASDQVRAKARAEGYTERRVLSPDNIDWASLQADMESHSLFSEKRIVELRMGEKKPGAAGAKALTAIARSSPKDNLLLISFSALPAATRKTAWFTTLERAGVEIHARPVTTREFPGWLAARARELGVHLSRGALELLSERTEGNLLAARQELQMLALCKQNDEELTPEQLEEIITDSGRYNSFALIENAYNGKAAHALRMLEGIRMEGAVPMAIFGALAWDLRRVCILAAEYEQGSSLDALCRKHRVWGSRVEAVKRFLKRNPPPRTDYLLQEMLLVEKALKGTLRDDPWSALTWFIMHLAGATPNYPVTTHSPSPT